MQNSIKSTQEQIPLIVPIIKKVWKHPIGKAAIIIGVGTLSFVAIGGMFEVLSYSMNQFKNFKRAYNR